MVILIDLSINIFSVLVFLLNNNSWETMHNMVYYENKQRGNGVPKVLKALKIEKPPFLTAFPLLYPAPESNRHGFPQVFETSASTNSASWAYYLKAGGQK